MPLVEEGDCGLGVDNTGYYSDKWSPGCKHIGETRGEGRKKGDRLGHGVSHRLEETGKGLVLN